MTPDEVYRAYIDGENSRDRAAMERCLHPDMAVMVNGEPQLADRDADAVATEHLLATFPDYRRSVHRTVVAGSTVVAEWSMLGEPVAGSKLGSLAVHGCTIAEVVDEQIVSAHLYVKSSVLDAVLDQSPHQSVP